MKKQKKNKRNFLELLPYAIGAVCGGFLGYFGMEGIFEGNGLEIAILILSFVVIVYGLIITHEAGHLVCGLLSGYKFVSFRIGSIIFVKRGDKILRKKFSIPGTGGQCLWIRLIKMRMEIIRLFCIILAAGFPICCSVP